MIFGLTGIHWLTLHGAVTLAALLTYVAASHVMPQQRNPAAAIGWVLLILLVPYLALPLFLVFGFRKQPRATRHFKTRPSAMRSATWAVETLMALGQPAPAAYHALNVHGDGNEALAALMEAIDGAQTSIDLCTFILARDALGEAVVDHLCRKTRDGVRVRVMVDGMGALMSRHAGFERLAAAGAQVALFVPPLRSPLKGRTNLRDHRKLVVVDGVQAGARLWCGGRNLACEYFELPGKAGQWRDLSFDLRGALAHQAADLFEQDWAFAKGQRPRPQQPLPSQASDAPEGAGAQLVASGPDQADDTIHALLLTAAYRAQHRILLATPYFVPDTALLMALHLAARRGVQVDLLLPAHSNHRLSDIARSRALRTLADAGAAIWLAPGMMHAKLAVVDSALALAGSANIDSRSLFLNYEAMVAFHKDADVHRFSQWFDRERATAVRHVARRPGLLRDVAEGTLLWLAFQL